MFVLSDVNYPSLREGPSTDALKAFLGAQMIACFAGFVIRASKH